MNLERAKIRRAGVRNIGRRAEHQLRTSDVVLAVVGVSLLAGLFMLGLANMVSEAQGLAGLSTAGSTETL